MSAHTFILYCLLISFIVYCPGPMTLFALTTAMQHGTKAAIPPILGSSLGYIILLITVFLGLGLILQHSIFLFSLIKDAGAAYLIYLGIRYWYLAVPELISHEKLMSSPSPKNLSQQGFLIGLTNPKAILTFTALIPHFIDHRAHYAAHFFSLGLLFISLQFISAVCYAIFGDKVFNWLKQRKKELLQQKIIGSILIAAGLVLVALAR